MKITILRGTNQIGGCVTEIESNGYKVFIDFGDQLPGVENDNNQLSQIDGLTCGDISKSALFITHYHGDHIGKICDAAFGLPIFLGETALEIYKCLEKRLSYIPDPKESGKHKNIYNRLKTINTFKPLQKMQVGKIIVTPLFIDHSAFDAYMFIIEADGKRILHTGDFRGHGFKSKALVPMLQKYAQHIDYIICEGSNIERPDAVLQTEQELQNGFEKQFKENKFSFVIVSSTNIDRIFSLYHAAKKARRCFVCDSYQAKVLKIVSQSHKQNTTFYDIDYDQKIKQAGRFFELKRIARKPFQFAGKLKPYLDKHGFCMLVRPNDSFKPILDKYHKLDETKIYYSMWSGYLDKTKPAFNPIFAGFIEPFKYEYKHTSGHADIKTLSLFFDTVKPKCGIIPIHTEAPDKFRELFTDYNIILLQDSCTFDTESENNNIKNKIVSNLIPVKYHGKNYPPHIEANIWEIAGNFDTEMLSINTPYSLHTEYSYGPRVFSSKTINDLENITSAQKNNIPLLWYNKKWADDFFIFIERLIGSNNPPEVLEIHPPFNNYCKSFDQFIEIYNVFYRKYKNKYGNQKIFIENRFGTMFSGGKFLLSTLSDVLNFGKILINENIDLKIVLDYPQIFSAEHVNLNEMNYEKIKPIIAFNHELKEIKEIIGGFHMWGKRIGKNGKWIAHTGNFNTFFSNNNELKHEFLSSVFSTFNDGVARYFVPEVNSGEDDLHSIIADMENEDFTFVK